MSQVLLVVLQGMRSVSGAFGRSVHLQGMRSVSGAFGRVLRYTYKE